jgi:hypothetical protein
MPLSIYARPNGKVVGDWFQSQRAMAKVYEDVTGNMIAYEAEPSTATIGNSKIYARMSSNSSTASSWDWYGGEDYGCGTGGIIAMDYGTGSTDASVWVEVENGWSNYGKPCKTKVLEWRVGYEDCTTTGSYNRVYLPTTASVKYRAWYEDGHIRPVDPKNRLRDMILRRQAPMVFTTSKTRNPLQVAADIREERARETLRRVLGESKFRGYITNGFVSVKAKSGLVYQIFPGHGITAVYDRGKMVDRLCVVLRGNFPPTDSLIMRYLMILNNEQQFRGYAIKHSVNQVPRQNPKIDERPLTEIFRELKGVA